MTSDLEFFRAAPSHQIELGSRLSYRRFGQGPAVLFVHGWPLNGATYRSLVRRLSSRFTCYVPDLPGAGESPWDPRIRALFSDMASLLARFVDALGLERVALVAHDSGGGIARLLSAELGTRVVLLALTNTEVPHHVPGLVRFYKTVAPLPGAAGLLRALLSNRTFRRSRLGFARAFANLEHLDSEFHEASVVPLLARPHNALSFIRAMEARFVHELPAIHARIEAPVVMAWGEDDPFFPVAAARAMGSQFRDLRAFSVLQGQRLFVHEEAPEPVGDLFEGWLRELHRPAKQELHATAR